MVSIIIPVFGQEFYTKQILEEIKEKVSVEHEIIILDGPDGVNQKWNQGVQQAKGSIVWIINNDLLLTQGLDTTLMTILESHKVACPISTRGKDPFCLPKITTTSQDNIAGWCFMMRKEDWVPIDERLDLWYGDNWIYETQKHSVGFGGLCHHFESKSINAPETIALVRKRINRDKLAWEVVKDEHPEWNRREKTEGIKLSILIPSVLSRYEKLGRILDQLKPQITDEVEVVVHTDNKKISLGDKRNKLLSLANGEYIVMIDDDDRITEDYVFELLKAIESGAECICYEVECSVNGGPYKKVYYSKDFTDRNFPDRYERIPNHIMCYRKDVAMRVPYSDLRYGEDSDYAKRLLPLINTEYKINKTLYYYDFIAEESECLEYKE